MSIAEKLTTIAENEQKVYEAGQQSEYDRFWDSFQKNGKRTRYYMGFGGEGWNDETFKPKYDLVPTQAQEMFREARITDMPAALERAGVTLDFSKCTVAVTNFIVSSYISHLGEINITGLSAPAHVFNVGTALVTVDKVILKADGSQTFTGFVSGCTELTNITIEGAIGRSIDFSPCPLSVVSMKNIISCLKNYSGTDKEFLYSVKFNDNCWAALEADSTSPTGTTWAEYVQDTLCWNI